MSYNDTIAEEGVPTGKKMKVVFAFVEAGLGHIMPMNAISDAFEQKYGDQFEIIRTRFFQDPKNPDMKYVEDELVKEVKLHNKYKIRGAAQFLLMKIFGSRISMKFLMETKYKKGFKASIEYMKELNPDLIVNTHFATLYYACQARSKGLIDPEIFAYCPDPIIGRQWDMRTDLIGLSSLAGKEDAIKSRRFNDGQLAVVPFLIRSQVKDYVETKEYYRESLGLPKDNFTVLLADGAYGAGKLKDTVYGLLKLNQKTKENEENTRAGSEACVSLDSCGHKSARGTQMTVIAVCGRNEQLYQEFLKIKAPENIHFAPYGFTDKMLTLSACCDLFVGKAGASNIAEPAYFGAPTIVTFRATPIEKWISAHYVNHVKSAVLEENIERAVKLVEKWAENPSLMDKYKEACKSQKRCDGPEMYADLIYERLKTRQEKQNAGEKSLE